MLGSKKKVAVVFGSRSVEHEVSIVTAMQIFENLDREKYKVIPVYIDKSGRWLIDDKLAELKSFKDLKSENIKAPEYLMAASPDIKKIFPKSALKFFKKIPVDIFFPAIHGTFGEDGTIQGLFELAGKPYVGSGVTGSAVGMDKIIQKSVFKDAGIPVVKYVWFTKSEWQDDKVEIIKKIETVLKYPVFVKPANLGSSVAIAKAVGLRELERAVDVASNFDRRIIVEEGKENIIEINCSVLGNNNLRASVCEQPLKGEGMLSYEDKYLKGGKVKGMAGQGLAGLSRLVPAPISGSMAERIREMAKTAFRAVDAAGIARIDFLVDEKNDKIWINEINTLPGSLSYYLWENEGLEFPKLLDKLIELGFEKHRERQEITFSYDSDLIAKSGGAKR